MCKVLLLDSPSWLLFDPRMHMHLGILYLAGSLREAGHDVKVLDCHKVTSWDGKNLIMDKSKMEPCDVLGVSATTANVNWGIEMARDWPATYKVLGGTHVTHIVEGPHQKFKQKKYFPVFDYLMYGECEEAFVEFCNIVDNDITYGISYRKDMVPGLVWFNDFGMQCNKKPSDPHVSKLPGPAFDLWSPGFSKGALSVSSAKGEEYDASSLMTASLYTARGCPYGCKFCADARTKLREETIEQTEHQVAQLAMLGVQAVRLQDDTFTIKEERCRAIADVLAKYNMKWRAMTRVNLKNPELFQYMSDRGCKELGFGVEHGSNYMLKMMQKGTTADANELGLKMCHDSGMVAKAFLLLGFPGETEETIKEMEDWVMKVKPDAVTLSLFQPFPGSDVWNHPENYSVNIPDGAFEKFWQLGGDGDPEMLILKLPTISRDRLFYHRQRLVKLFEQEIGSLDRTRLHGNIGTFGPTMESLA